jgi:hypothetical protein
MFARSHVTFGTEQEAWDFIVLRNTDNVADLKRQLARAEIQLKKSLTRTKALTDN